MKKMTLFSAILWISGGLLAQTTSSISIIPWPVSLKQNSGAFVITNGITREAPLSNPEAVKVATLFSKKLAGPTGIAISVSTRPATSARIRLVLFEKPNKELGDEGYSL